MDRDRQELMKKLLAVLAVLITAVAIGHAVSVISFNQREHSTKGADERKKSYLAINDREDSTSRWVKRGYDLYGESVDLSAQTFDATLFNNSAHDITDWKLTIRIREDCFINNAWCGTIEIHQHAGTKDEKVQTLDLRSYDLEDVKLDHLYDGDLLIPLSEGDYLVYEPSAKDDELPVKAGSELTIGMIIYYLDSVDLSDYRLDYHYHSSFREGAGFYAILVLCALWLALFIALVTSVVSYKRLWKEMELRVSGISYMSAIYELVYFADIENDELVSLRTDNDDANISRIKGAGEKLTDMLSDDADERYRGAIREFADLSTLDSRLVRDSISCEYISKSRGWCRARFIAMDRAEGEPLKRVIFTIRDINEERQETVRLLESIQETKNTTRLALETGEYGFREMIEEVAGNACAWAKSAGAEFTAEISPKIPEVLTGNEGLMRHAVSYLVRTVIESSSGGPVKLSVYSKTSEDSAHILISVTGKGKDSEYEEAGLELADGLLGLMDSALKTIRGDDGSRELYFETEQPLAGNETAGDK